MSFTYSITDKEFQEYIKAFYKKTFLNRKSMIVLIILGTIIFSNIYNWMTKYAIHNEEENGGGSMLGSILNYTILISIMVGIGYFLFKKLGRSLWVKNQDRDIILGERTLTVDTEQVQSKTINAGTTYQWDAIKRWEQTTNLYLLYITSNAAIILPKRVFTSEVEQEEFETLLKTKIQNLSDARYLDA